MRLRDEPSPPSPLSPKLAALIGAAVPHGVPTFYEPNPIRERARMAGNLCVVRQVEKTNTEMCHASSGNWYCRANRRNFLAARLAHERADRCRQSFSNENLSSQANQTDVSDAPTGKTSPHASRPRTPAIMDGKVVSCPAPACPTFLEIHNPG